VNGASNEHAVPLKSRSDSALKKHQGVGANDAVAAARLDREADRPTEPRRQRMLLRARPWSAILHLTPQLWNYLV